MKAQNISNTPLMEQSLTYQRLYNYFNESLFDGLLEPPMLLLSRNPNVTGGYFIRGKWFNEDEELIDEIAINVNHMGDRDVAELCQVLIHEMIHQWQAYHGTPGRGGYHNREFADKCWLIGLRVWNTRDPEKDTGDSISSELIDQSPAQKAIKELDPDLILPWLTDNLVESHQNGGEEEDRDPEERQKERKKSGKRSKYTCPQCGLNVWAKAGVRILCMECDKELVETL